MPEPPMMPSTDRGIGTRPFGDFETHRGRACPGHLDYLALCANLRSRRDKPAATPWCGLRRGLRGLRMIHVVPDFLLAEVEQYGQAEHENDRHEADPLALFERRLGRPHQEGGDVLGVLID